MISTTIDMYLETLAGYIFDDDKLVTYKWLSKELGLHVNSAKQILWQFWKEHDKRKEVLPTFALIGHLADGIFRVEVVKESDLSSAKKKFNKIIGEHLYSLQRALPDIEILALTGPGDHKQAAIVCTEIIPRGAEELYLLRWGSKLGDVKTASNFTKKFTKPTSITSIESKSKAEKNTLHNIFERAINVKSKLTKPPVLDTRKEVVLRGRKRQGSAGHRTISSKRQKRKSTGDFQSSRESSSNEDERLEIACDPEEVVPPENDAEISPPKYKIEQGKRKVRKVIDKTLRDDNGYFVTKKEYVYESCSDTEEVADTPELETPKPQAAPESNHKQASLFNFFKKS